jgi:hypothetical protein
MLRKTKGYVSLRLSKTDYSKLNRLRGPQADTSCVTSDSNYVKPYVSMFLCGSKIATPININHDSIIFKLIK